MRVSLGDLAEQLGCELIGDPNCIIEGIGSLDSAQPGLLSFLSHSRFRRHLEQTRASAVILSPADASRCPVSALVCENPYAAYALATAVLYPETSVQPHLDPMASIADDVQLGAEVSIGPGVTIEQGVSIGARTIINAGVCIGAGSRVGEDCRLHANASIYPNTSIGNQVLIHSGAVIGADGFGFANRNGQWIKVKQIGRVIIGDQVEIGANTTIDRGALGDTVIERGVKLDNQIQVAHNVRLGEDTAIAGCVGIAGSATIGKRCTIGGGSVILGHLSITDDVHITAMSLVTGSISTAGAYSSGTPLEENRSWRRNFVRYKQLDEMARRINKLEKMLEATEEKKK